MESIQKNILITGRPGVGKTTLVKNLVESLRHLHPVGFYTSEIRKGEKRKGFELISLDGTKGLLSHTDIRSSYRVGKYRVDIKSFDEFLDSIAFLNPSCRLIIIDEIGKMECLSDLFKKRLKEYLDSEKQVIATIALKGSGLIEETKRRTDVTLFEMTPRNRNALLSQILREVERDD